MHDYVIAVLPVADPDLELREARYPDLELRGRGAGFVLLALLAFLPSVISPFFYPKLERGGGGRTPPALPLDLPLFAPEYDPSLFKLNTEIAPVLYFRSVYKEL